MKNTEIMNDKEIALSIKLFKKAISKNAITYEHADPIEQNCYISSAGAIIGVYFPNTQFSQKLHPSYKICSLSKVGGALGVVFALSNEARERLSERARIYFDDYIFASFDSLLYTREELNIKQKIEKRLQNYKNQLKALQNIKRAHKKNGGDFARVLDNFTGARFSYDWGIVSPVVYYIDLHFDYSFACREVRLYRSDENKNQNAEPTISEIAILIEAEKDRTAQRITQEVANLKMLNSDFAKFEKITKKLKEFLNSVPNKYDFKSELNSMLL